MAAPISPVVAPGLTAASAEKKRVNGDAGASGFEAWTWQTYAQRYHMQMRLSYGAHRDAWDKLIEQHNELEWDAPLSGTMAT